MTTSANDRDVETLTIADLDERYAKLRLTSPAAERALCESLRRLGQLVPIVVCERGAGVAIVDGFKRLAAARTLDLATLRARVMPLGETAALAAVLTLNRPGRGTTDLEEAMVVRALCREHRLEQTQIAELLGRHKSWVCRRLALAERLDDTVAGDVRAGLITTTVARELARLPRGNQASVAAAIRRVMLGSRDARLLVTLFAKTSGATERHDLLDHPREALEAQHPRAPSIAHDPRLGPLAQGVRIGAFKTIRAETDLAVLLDECSPARWTAIERSVLDPLLRKVRATTEVLAKRLADAQLTAEASNAA